MQHFSPRSQLAMAGSLTCSPEAAACAMVRSLRRRREACGLTLVELLTVIAMVAILASVAVPGVTSMGESMRLSSHANAFLSALHLTRSEAIKRNARVTLCKSADGVQCADGGGWHQGWIVFHDVNHNAVRDADEALIHQTSSLPGGFRLIGNLPVSKYVSFSPSGTTVLTSGAFQAGTLSLCRESATAVEGRQIVISGTGRSRILRSTTEACG